MEIIRFSLSYGINNSPLFKQIFHLLDVLIGIFNGKNDAYKNCLEKITLIPNLFGTVEETVILCSGILKMSFLKV